MKKSLILLCTAALAIHTATFAESDCEVSCCKAPSVVDYSQPELPEGLLKSGETAEIVLRAAIDEDGKLIGTKTIKSSHDELEKVVAAAVKEWTFDASVEMGTPTRSTIDIPFKFTVATK